MQSAGSLRERLMEGQRPGARLLRGPLSEELPKAARGRGAERWAGLCSPTVAGARPVLPVRPTLWDRHGPKPDGTGSRATAGVRASSLRP